MRYRINEIKEKKYKFKSRLIIRDLSTRDFESFVIHIWMNYPCVFCERQTFKTLKIGQKHFQNTVEKFFRKHCGLRSVFFFSFFSSLPLFIQSRFPKLGSSHLNEFDYERNNGPYERTEFHQFLFRTNG